MSEITYCIPTTLINAYRGRSIVVRAPDALTLTQNVPPDGFDGLEYVRLTSLAGGADPLQHWGQSIPLDLVLSSPAEQFPELYKWSDLLDTRPVRVSMPVAPGFSKAVKLAASLHFEIKLEPGQPDEPAVTEMLRVLEFYLHDSAVSQPVEFFHSVLMAFSQRERVSLWRIQEEDPAEFRYVAEDGTERPFGRLAGLSLHGPVERNVEEFERTLLAGGAECAQCEFQSICHGYFKAPAEDFSCDGVKSIFEHLRQAAAELKRDVEACRDKAPSDRP